MRIGCDSKCADDAFAVEYLPVRKEVVICVEYSDAARSKAREYFAFGLCYTSQRTDTFQVCRCSVRDGKPVRSRKPANWAAA